MPSGLKHPTISKVALELEEGQKLSIINLVQKLVEEACELRASDIHLDPQQDVVRIRYRIDGVLQDAHTCPKSMHSEIISRVKILAGLRTDEHQSAQDGRFRVSLESGQPVDVRVSIAPTYHGENTVLRLLSDKADDFTLMALGFSEYNRQKIQAALKRPYGMILATGPTASGSAWLSAGLDTYGTVTFNGTSFTTQQSNSSFNYSDNLDVRPGASLSLPNATTFIIQGDLYVDATTSRLTYGGTNFEFDGGYYNAGGNSAFSLSGKNLTIGGNKMSDFVCYVTGDFNANTGVGSVVINKTFDSSRNSGFDLNFTSPATNCTLTATSVTGDWNDSQNGLSVEASTTLNVTGALNIGGNTARAGGGPVTMYGGSTLNFTGSSWISGSVSNGGTFNATSGGPVSMYGGYYSKVGASYGTYNAGANTHVLTDNDSDDGDFDLYSANGGVFNLGSGTLYIDSLFQDGGSGFHAGTGTVIFNGPGADGTIQEISGSNTFYNFTKINTSSADTLIFDHGTTQTISNTLTLQGVSGKVLALRSDSTPLKWTISAPGGTALCYLDVKDSTSTGATLSGFQLTSSGNNTGWNFVSTGSCSGGGGGGGATSTDLSLTKTVNKTSANVGDSLVYTLVAKNTGTLDATGTAVSDTLPAGLTVQSSSATAGSFSGSTWTLGTFASSSSATLTLTTLVGSAAGGSNISNSATITSNTPDPNSANNTATSPTTAVAAAPSGNGNSGGGGGGGAPGAGMTYGNGPTTSTPPVIPAPIISRPIVLPPVVSKPTTPAPVSNPPAKAGGGVKPTQPPQPPSSQPTNLVSPAVQQPPASPPPAAVVNSPAQTSAQFQVKAATSLPAKLMSFLYVSALPFLLMQAHPGFAGIDNFSVLALILFALAGPAYLAAARGLPLLEMFGNLKSFSDAYLALYRAWLDLLGLLGLRKKRRYWGTVYDSQNKQPLDPVLVSLHDAATGQKVETCISDLAGQFGFLVQPGRFILRAEKSNYNFPSKQLTGETDNIFEHLYHGEILEIKSQSDVLSPNIPMDATAFDWNQQAKQALVKVHPQRDYLFFLLSSSLFRLGFLLSILSTVLNPSLFNFGLLAIYAAAIFAEIFNPPLRLWGRLYHGKTFQALPNCLLQLSFPQVRTVAVSKARTGPDGKFFLKSNPGKYVLTALGEDKKILASLEVTVGKNSIVNWDIAV